MIYTDGSFEEIKGADHLSVPADLRMHITSHTDHIRFDISPIWDMLDNLSLIPITHIFTFIGVPFVYAKPLVKQFQRKLWHQAALISPIPDDNFSSDSRMCVEFFIHSMEFLRKNVEGLPFTIPRMNMRVAPDRSGAVFGPFWFGELQRRNCPSRPDVTFSIRMCYSAPQDNRPVTFTYTPLAEFDRRPRAKAN